VLRRIQFTVEDVTAMHSAVNIDGHTPFDAARSWMAQHQDRVNDWLA
jgi:ABC-type proline/glycine betaine transport system substrate-binding protein